MTTAKSKDKEEAITKAAQCADMLAIDIRQAHKAACVDDPVLEIMLRELLSEAAKLATKLRELDGCFR